MWFRLVHLYCPFDSNWSSCFAYCIPVTVFISILTSPFFHTSCGLFNTCHFRYCNVAASLCWFIIVTWTKKIHFPHSSIIVTSISLILQTPLSDFTLVRGFAVVLLKIILQFCISSPRFIVPCLSSMFVFSYSFTQLVSYSFFDRRPSSFHLRCRCSHREPLVCAISEPIAIYFNFHSTVVRVRSCIA